MRIDGGNAAVMQRPMARSRAPSLFTRIYNFAVKIFKTLFWFLFPKEEPSEPEFKVSPEIVKLIKQIPPEATSWKQQALGLLGQGLMSAAFSYWQKSSLPTTLFIGHKSVEGLKSGLYSYLDKEYPDIIPYKKKQFSLAVSATIVYLASFPIWHQYRQWADGQIYAPGTQGSPFGWLFIIGAAMQGLALSNEKYN